MNKAEPGLSKTLGPFALWGLGVGYVISGEYFGWNLGLPIAGTQGMAVLTAAVTLLYVCFVLSYAELACALPRAGGAYVYAERALGPRLGLAAGVAQIVEFAVATPAIALSIGGYVEQRFALDPRVTASLAYLGFTALNVWGVRQAALFEVAVTIIAVVELLVFMGVVAPAVELSRLALDQPPPAGWLAALGALPFALWFYLAIEGVANAAEEARHPQRDVPLGFGWAMLTLVVLTVGVFVAAVGVAGWEAVVFDPPGSQTTSDAPLPLALRQVVAKDSALYTALLAIGIFALIASFHGLVLAGARAMMEFGRSGFGPAVLGQVHATTRTPVVALLVNLGLGLLAIWSGKTPDIIALSCFGALALYLLSMLSLFALRRREPTLERPFRAVLYPVAPAIALLLAALGLVAMSAFYPWIAGIFVGLIALALALQWWREKKAPLDSASGARR